MTAELQAFVDLIKVGGLPLIIAFLFIGGQKGWYLWGPNVTSLLKDKDTQIALITKDRDDWKELAQRGTSDAKLLIEWAVKLQNENKK